ncbi:M15 family metallopeptidase [Kineococcus gypseus]|uniref:M15 family metallopeptidase n=1 Tax=Kineococcus gypseus TaxID=1637102 RepID=UPI003D7E069F
MPSPFAAERLPDGRRRYSRSTVVARRRLLLGVLAAGAAAAGAGQLRGGTTAGADPVQLPSTSAAGSPWVVVNKRLPIDPPGYAPAALVEVAGKPVAAVVAPHLGALLAAARAEGVELPITSGYRSVEHQRAVHERAVARDGLAAAERVSARPGHSEHQTGLAVDFGSATSPGCALQGCYQDTPEARWLAARAGEFGFLLRYPADRTAVTGYDFEPWHYRWVGTDLLERMRRRGTRTLEEHFDLPGGPYPA